MTADKRYALSVINTALAVKMAITGSGDGLPDAALQRFVNFLGARISTWEDGLAVSESFDEGVRLMAEAAFKMGCVELGRRATYSQGVAP